MKKALLMIVIVTALMFAAVLSETGFQPLWNGRLDAFSWDREQDAMSPGGK